MLESPVEGHGQLCPQVGEGGARVQELQVSTLYFDLVFKVEPDLLICVVPAVLPGCHILVEDT